MSAEEDLPEGPTSPTDEPGLPPGNFELPPTPLEVVIPLIRDRNQEMVSQTIYTNAP